MSQTLYPSTQPQVHHVSPPIILTWQEPFSVQHHRKQMELASIQRVLSLQLAIPKLERQVACTNT